MKIPKNAKISDAKRYLKKVGLEIVIKNSLENNKKNTDQRFSKKVYQPEINDLYRLYKFIVENKRTRILEYGTGWSSLVMYKALMFNKNNSPKIPYPRIKNPFSLTVVDDNKKYLSISKKRIDKFFSKKTNISFNYSECRMTTYNGKIASHYTKHPNINPDFIYLDGPDQFKIKGKVNNITVADYEMMPMACDILKFENFLTPGTIILTDGRAANAIFLERNFQRNWIYRFDEKNDQSIFYLNEKPLGPLNKEQLKFYKKKY